MNISLDKDLVMLVLVVHLLLKQLSPVTVPFNHVFTLFIGREGAKEFVSWQLQIFLEGTNFLDLQSGFMVWFGD